MSFEPVKNPVLTIELERPITFYGESVSKIALREPRAGDIFRCGNPVIRFDFDDGSVEFDEKKAFAMVSLLSGITFEGSLEFMTSNDAMNCFHGVARFFIPGLRTRPVEPLTSSPKPDAPPAS